MAPWKYSKGWTIQAKRVFSKQYAFLCYKANQSRGSTRRPSFTTWVKPSIKCIVISVYLNSVWYLILYTRLFTKLNLFEILLNVTFIAMKVFGSTVYTLNPRACGPRASGVYIKQTVLAHVTKIYTYTYMSTYYM